MVEVSLPNVSAEVASNVTINILVDDLTGLDVISYSLRVGYDAEVLTVTGFETNGTISDVEGSSKVDNKKEGQYTFVFAAPSSRPLAGEGTLVKLKANVEAEGSSPLEFLYLRLETVEEEVSATAVNGTFQTGSTGNTAPEQPTILDPAQGTAFTVGGGSGEPPIDGGETLFTIDWTEVEDPQGDEVTYRLEVADDAAFNTVIDQIAVQAATELNVSVSRAAQWFDTASGEAGVGASETVYVRVVASDGELETASESSSITLVRGTITSIGDAEVPDAFALVGNYPNPFNPTTNVTFDLPQQALVAVDVYDALGRRVLASPEQAVEAGQARSLALDASALPSGMYVYRVTARMAQATSVGTGVMTLSK